ncbi:MAG: pectate lyase [Bacteroidota bacterium]
MKPTTPYKRVLYIAGQIVLAFLLCYHGKATPAVVTDPVAENMLMFQRSNGGWNKHLDEKAVNYNKTYTPEEQASIRSKATALDATIDNEATTKEIKYLVKANKKTDNKAYLDAAERGIQYLLSAQYENGGWPQYYPDKSSYRSQVTFNDNAIINVITVMEDIVAGKNDFDAVNKSFIPKAAAAIQKAISCILATQIKANGKLTAWCTQYNAKTLVPEMARKFELASISAFESVNIVRFLMRQPNPSPEMKQAITAAVQWFDAVKIPGHSFVEIADAKQPKGKDRVFVEDANSTIWARFYEIETNRPMFSGRDSEKKYSVAEIEAERRVGYAWYGNWPAKLLDKEYPAWLKAN